MKKEIKMAPKTDSNRRPPSCNEGALPTELRGHRNALDYEGNIMKTGILSRVFFAIILILLGGLGLFAPAQAVSGSFTFTPATGIQDGMAYKDAKTTSYNGSGLNMMPLSSTADSGSFAYVGDLSIDDTLGAHGITGNEIDSVIIYTMRDIIRNLAAGDTMLFFPMAVEGSHDWLEASVCYNNLSTGVPWTTPGGDVYAVACDTERVTTTTGSQTADTIYTWHIKAGPKMDSLCTATGNRGWRLEELKAGAALGNESIDFYSSEASAGLQDSIKVFYTEAAPSGGQVIIIGDATLGDVQHYEWEWSDE